jgi:hypothetical protein
MSFIHLLKCLETESVRPGDLVVDVGTKAFVTTGATVEVATPLTEVLFAFLTIDNSVTYGVNDQLSTDKVVTTGAVTVVRNAAGTSALSFSYMFIGRKESAT